MLNGNLSLAMREGEVVILSDENFKPIARVQFVRHKSQCNIVMAFSANDSVHVDREHIHISKKKDYEASKSQTKTG